MKKEVTLFIAGRRYNGAWEVHALRATETAKQYTMLDGNLTPFGYIRTISKDQLGIELSYGRGVFALSREDAIKAARDACEKKIDALEKDITTIRDDIKKIEALA